MNRLNKNLKAEIVRTYGSQATFALKAKINESTVSKVVHGRKQLAAHTKKKWARLLKTEEESIFPAKAKKRILVRKVLP
jgi:hypothetical protein